MRIVIAIFLLIISQNIVAQSKTNWGYMNGVIHLKKGDSIRCLIEKQLVYEQTLGYKLNEWGVVEEIPIAAVNYFEAGNKIFESVLLYGAFKLIERLDTGKISLYYFNEIKYGETKKSNSTGVKTKKGDIIIHYVVKQKQFIQEIKEPVFKPVLKQLFFDCERMAGKVSRGG